MEKPKTSNYVRIGSKIITDSNKTIKQEELINFEGEKDATLFYRVLKDAFVNDLAEEINNKMEQYTKNYESAGDDRAIAIIGALIIENELDYLLATWIKDYARIKNKREMTLSFKTELAISLKLIPTKILNAIEPIRKIRNIFAHDLDITSFNAARQTKPEDFELLYTKIHTLINWTTDGSNTEDDKKTFKQLVFLASLALRLYSKHLDIVQKYITIDENLTKIMKNTN